jgi:hypothetical protein
MYVSIVHRRAANPTTMLSPAFLCIGQRWAECVTLTLVDPALKADLDAVKRPCAFNPRGFVDRSARIAAHSR